MIHDLQTIQPVREYSKQQLTRAATITYLLDRGPFILVEPPEKS